MGCGPSPAHSQWSAAHAGSSADFRGHDPAIPACLPACTSTCFTSLTRRCLLSGYPHRPMEGPMVHWSNRASMHRILRNPRRAAVMRATVFRSVSVGYAAAVRVWICFRPIASTSMQMYIAKRTSHIACGYRSGPGNVFLSWTSLYAYNNLQAGPLLSRVLRSFHL
ncbi:hypothetical protein C8Q70DRAFT_687209 [Cubamyces menziesii]|nr:hypothetical protein C8Q70DRAFT_687209 [Cubamyces menziesii]